MYQHSDYQENRDQLRSRLLAVGIPAALLLILTLVSFFLRWPEALTVILCIALCSLCIFSWSMLISPLLAYGKHVDHALNGRTRDTEGLFVSMEEECVGRDGVEFYPMTINVGDKNAEKDMRLFYYDANLPRPEWQPGDLLKITSYDNRVTKWEKL